MVESKGAAITGIMLSSIPTRRPEGNTRTSRQNAAVEEKCLLQVAVTDTDPGIPAAFREQLFETRFRVEHHRAGGSYSIRGAGIGLYLCWQIIEAYGRII
jgi:signal transduction histidine kinase